MLATSYFVTLYFLLLLIVCTAFAAPDTEKIASAAENNGDQQLSTPPQQNDLKNNVAVSNTPTNAIPADNNDNNDNDPTTDPVNLTSPKGDYVDGAASATKNNPSPVLADKNLPKSNEQRIQEKPDSNNDGDDQEEKQQNTEKKDDSPSEKQKPIAATTPAEQQSQHGPLVKIKSEDEFCFFLPPGPKQEVAPTEDYGVAHCTSDDVVKGNKVFPDGFITKKHYNYNKNSSYVQVTGYLDSEKYGLLANDDGGQYDDHHKGKPIGAKCDGYPYFVNLVEPSNQRFCIRCCKHKVDCNTGKSQNGCINIIPGDYSDDELVEKVFENVANQEKQVNSSPSLQQQVDALVKLASQSTTDRKKMEAEWEMFIQHLQTTYPSEIDMLTRASQTTDWFTTVSQWWYFLGQLSVQIHNYET